jgi:hypothetical protein
MPSPGKPQRLFPFSVVSLLAAAGCWVALFAAGRVSTAPFSEGAGTLMFILLWIGAAGAVTGLVLGILAVRIRAPRWGVGIVGLVLNLVNLAAFAYLGLFWLALSL